MKKKYIKTDEWEGYDRRNGDMKFKDILTPTVIITLVLALISLGGYKLIVQATAEIASNNVKEIASLKDRTVVINNDVIRLDTNQKEVIKKVDKVLDNQETMTKTLIRLETKIERL